MLHIFGYLKCHHGARLVFDPSYPDLNYEDFNKKDWSGFYGDEKEALPLNVPEARGKEFIIKTYVDASFAGW